MKTNLRKEWAQAVTEGRVVRMNKGERFMMFPTIAMRDAYITNNPDVFCEIAPAPVHKTEDDAQ